MRFLLKENFPESPPTHHRPVQVCGGIPNSTQTADDISRHYCVSSAWQRQAELNMESINQMSRKGRADMQKTPRKRANEVPPL